MIVPLAKDGELWSTEIPESFEAITLHASGWTLHDFRVGNAGLMWAPEPLVLHTPVRVAIRGQVAMRIVVTLTGGADTPFVVLDPVREPRRPRAFLPRLVLDPDWE